MWCGHDPKGLAMTFRPLSLEEYERLTLQERLEYLHYLHADIAAKLEEGRTRLEAERFRQRVV